MIHDRAVLDGLAELHGVEIQWFSDWYDGPVDGLAAYNGLDHWFAAVFEPDMRDWHPREYVLHPLTPDQAVREWAEHRDYAARTGGPGCVHTPSCPTPPAGQADWDGWWRDHLDAALRGYVETPPIGWFTVSG
jgi:hypothetical protein